MNQTVKEKAVNLEDLQAFVRTIFNKGLGNSGTCTTAAATAAKEVTLGTTFELVTDATILVKFANDITVANATLAITHTTLAGTTTTEAAKPIYLKGAALEANVIDAGSIVMMRYNGTQFDIVGGAGDGGADAAYLDDYDGSAGAPDFDAYLDTVHTTAQTLNSTKKAQARTNIDVYSKAEIDAMRAPTYSSATKGIAYQSTSGVSYNSSTKGISLTH